MNTVDIKNLTIEDELGTQLISNVDFTIYNKQVNAIIGESGAGKTLLMRFILHQLPSHFRVKYNQFTFNNQENVTIQYQLGKDIGYISQNYTQSFNDHSKLGKQLVAIYRTHYDVTKQEAISKVKEALGWVNLEGEFILQRYSFQLSGGQLERVYIASVLMLNPKLIIADEPVASLDVVNGQQIMNLLQHIVKDHHQTLLIVTHNMSHVLKYADYINVMQSGQIIDCGDLDYFQSHHTKPYSQQLLKFRSHLKRDEHD